MLNVKCVTPSFRPQCSHLHRHVPYQPSEPRPDSDAAMHPFHKCQLRDKHWLEDELRRKGWAEETATTRVRFFWHPDIHGKMQVYGVHTGEGTPYESVRVANMVWDAKIQSYTFTPAPGLDGPTITWAPEKPEGSEPVAHTGSPVNPIDQPTILIYPIPEDETETTTPPFPVPDEHDPTRQ